jgi:hypothetical protein
LLLYIALQMLLSWILITRYWRTPGTTARPFGRAGLADLERAVAAVAPDPKDAALGTGPVSAAAVTQDTAAHLSEDGVDERLSLHANWHPELKVAGMFVVILAQGRLDPP